MNWYEKSGPNSGIVLCTKVQLSRNLEEYPFVNRLSIKLKEELCIKVSEALNQGELETIKMSELNRFEAVSLAEKQLISPEFASAGGGRTLLLGEENGIAIMLCEEDHVKIQTIMPGLCPKNTYSSSEIYDKRLEQAFCIAFNKKLGYLTQSPTGLGTGLRASVLLHLPLLHLSGAIGRLASTVSNLGMTLRPAYGERSRPAGDIFYLANQVTLGISEETAINNLELIANQIAAQEESLRQTSVDDASIMDKIYRSFGVLSNSYMLSAAEFINMLSFVRLGACTGKLPLDVQNLTKLFIEMQSATLSISQPNDLTIPEREQLRAEKVRTMLKQK